MPKSMILYEREIATLLDLPEEQRNHIFTALLCVSLGREPPALDTMEMAVFSLISAQVTRAAELSEKRRQSAKSRWENKQEDTRSMQGDTNAMQNNANLCNADTSLYTSTITPTTTPTSTATETKTDTDTPSVPSKGAGNGFDEFWKAYPKKCAKPKAMKAWSKLNPDAELQQAILDALERQKQTVQWQKDNGQYIPYPATWLNGRYWENVLEQSFQPPAKQDFDPNNPYKDWGGG